MNHRGTYLAFALLALSLISQTVGLAKPKSVAQQIGWVDNHKANACGGYYIEPLLDFISQGILKKDESNITARYGSLFLSGGRSVLRDHPFSVSFLLIQRTSE